MVVQAYAVCIRVTPECRQTESEMIGDGRGHADKADEAYHDIQGQQGEVHIVIRSSWVIHLPQQGIRSAHLPSGLVGQDEVKPGEAQGPSCLAVVQFVASQK